MAEVQRLRQLLSTSCFRSNDSRDAHTNKSSRSNNGQQGSNSEAGQQTQFTAQQKTVVDVEKTSEGEIGEKGEERKRPAEIGNKTFVTLVENLKGDPGVNFNSSDSKQRKAASLKESPVKKSLENKLREKAGEF